MKYIYLFILCLALSFNVQAQSTIEKTAPVRSGQKVNFDFKWPELVNVKTWDKNEVKVVAKVDINKGQNDDAFKFNIVESEGVLSIASEIENYKDLPRKIVIKMNGQEYFFNTDDRNSPEIKAFEEEHGSSSYSYVSHGVITDITVEIWLPKSVEVDIYSKFGLVEISDFSGPLMVHSKFGGIDLATAGQSSIKAGTKFGEKYTNLEVPVEPIQVGSHPGKWDWVQLGRTNGEIRELKSEFGNIYIRKQ